MVQNIFNYSKFNLGRKDELKRTITTGEMRNPCRGPQIRNLYLVSIIWTI